MEVNDKRYVLMSLREEYFNQMLDGSKRHEFRSRYAKTKTIAFIYLSRDRKEVVAKINFGIPKYDGENYAIPVEKITFIEKIDLKTLRNKFNVVVPQSWYYLESKPELLAFLLDRDEIETFSKLKN